MVVPHTATMLVHGQSNIIMVSNSHSQLTMANIKLSIINHSHTCQDLVDREHGNHDNGQPCDEIILNHA